MQQWLSIFPLKENLKFFFLIFFFFIFHFLAMIFTAFIGLLFIVPIIQGKITTRQIGALNSLNYSLYFGEYR